MKTNLKKSILSGALVAAIFSTCLTANAAPATKPANTIAVSDTGKMDKMKMGKMDKMDKMKKKKMDKMSKSKMKMGKDSSKM